MVGKHIADDAGIFKIAGTATNSHRFRHVDLDMVDVMVIPEWFENAIGKTKDKDILDCFFS
jgi:hypothetical protein